MQSGISEIKVCKASIRLKNSGFTLIEVMVAFAISIVIGMLAYQSFSIAAEAAQQGQKKAELIDALDRAWQILDRDLRHTHARPSSSALRASSLGGGGISSSPFLGVDPQDGFVGADQYILSFTRTGWSNPLAQMRSDLQGIGYLFIDGKLWRHYWPIHNGEFEQGPGQVLDEDTLIEGQTRQQLLLEEIEEMSMSFFSPPPPPTGATGASGGVGSWNNQWPAVSSSGTSSGSSLPAAVSVTLKVKDFGEATRIFVLASS